MSAPMSHSIAEYRRGYRTDHRLLGLRSSCGFVTVTWGLLCPRCGRRDLSEVELSGRGRIIAATVQTVPAQGFVHDAPYAYVVVELEEGARLTGWMPAVADPRTVEAGTPVRWLPSERSGLQFERDPEAAPLRGPPAENRS